MRTQKDQDDIDLNVSTVIQNGNYYYEAGGKTFISRREAEQYLLKQIALKYRDKRREENK